MQKLSVASSAQLVAVVIAFWGCGKAATRPADTTSTSAERHEQDDDTTTEAANAEIMAAFAELSAEDRAIAEKQKVCPVSDQLLGTMGAPIKIDVQGKPVFICCESCKEELLSKPDEYLAKLKN